jgi:hypothetical protein
MGLSKKGFNNILIFTMLSIIFIANFSHLLFESENEVTQTIIHPSKHIVEIQTVDLVIKRVGRSWSTEPSIGRSEQQLADIIQRWQTTPLSVYEGDFDDRSPYIIKIYLIEQIQPIIVKLYQNGDNYLLQTNEMLLLQLNAAQFPLFFGI